MVASLEVDMEVDLAGELSFLLLLALAGGLLVGDCQLGEAEPARFTENFGKTPIFKRNSSKIRTSAGIGKYKVNTKYLRSS